MLKKIISWFKNFFKNNVPDPKSPVNHEESGYIENPPSTEYYTPSKSEPITISSIENLLMFFGFKYLGAKEKGENTDFGGPIDMFIRTMGGIIGHAWCAYFVSWVVTQVCNFLGINYPEGLYKGGSSQKFWHKTNSKYIVWVAKKGRAFIWTNPGKSTGHIGLARGYFNGDGSLFTVEGNSSNQVAAKKQPASRVKLVSCYIDIPQAIYDQCVREGKIAD